MSSFVTKILKLGCLSFLGVACISSSSVGRQQTTLEASSLAAPSSSLVKEANQVRNDINANLPGSVDRGIRLLGANGIEGQRPLRSDEITALVELAAVVIDRDGDGDSDSYFYDLYVGYKVEVTRAMNSLQPAARITLQKALERQAKVWKNGNG